MVVCVVGVNTKCPSWDVIEGRLDIVRCMRDERVVLMLAEGRAKHGWWCHCGIAGTLA